MIRRLLMLAIALPLAAACGGARTPSSHPDGTAATSEIGGDQLANTQSGRMEDLLARVPGLEVVRASGGDFELRIRGGRISGGTNAEPLLIIDGMQVRAGGNGQALTGMNPQDVARVEVLKDAGSTAIYGSAGVNGVVIITTKRGRRP